MKFGRSSVARAAITDATEVTVYAVLYGALRERKEQTLRLGELKIKDCIKAQVIDGRGEAEAVKHAI